MHPYWRNTDPRPVLVVEDSDDDFETIVDAALQVGVANRLVRAVDADGAARLLSQHLPDDFAFMLLDYRLPGRDGLSLLRQLRGDPQFAKLPIVVFSTSVNPRDREVFYDSGANAYHVKPMQYSDGVLTLAAIFVYWLNHVVLPQDSATGTLSGLPS